MKTKGSLDVPRRFLGESLSEADAARADLTAARARIAELELTASRVELYRNISNNHAHAAEAARAEVERLTRERDEARGEVERLRAEEMALHADYAQRWIAERGHLLDALAAERERVERLRAEVLRAREMRDLLRVGDVPGWRVSAEGMQAAWDAWCGASDALDAYDAGVSGD